MTVLIIIACVIGWLILTAVCAQFSEGLAVFVLTLPFSMAGLWAAAAVAAAGARYGWHFFA